MLQNPFKYLSDEAVHQGLLNLAQGEKEVGVDIIFHLLLVRDRKLYATWGHDSVFTYCTERLGFSRSTAYRRKTVVDRTYEFPALLDRLRDGRLQLCAAAAVAPHLTQGNAEELLGAVVGLSHREVASYLVKRLRPLNAQTATSAAPTPLKLVAFADSPSRAIEPAAQVPRPRTMIKPLTADTSRINVTFSEETLAKFKRAKELLAGKSDDEIFGRALDEMLERLAPERRHARREKRTAKRDATRPPDPLRPQASSGATASRRGSLADRDSAAVAFDGQCAFVGPDGHRCTSRAFIEIDHIVPWSAGGPSVRGNYQPLCRTHNAFKGATMPAGRLNAETEVGRLTSVKMADDCIVVKTMDIAGLRESRPNGGNRMQPLSTADGCAL